MNIKTKLKGLFALCVAAIGITVFGDPAVTINEVKSVEPWDSATGAITVDYSLDGIDADTDYEVVFEVTVNCETRRVRNAAAKLTAGKQPVKTIDTATLFGKEVTTQAAKVKVTLSTVKAGTPEPLPEGQVKLWREGPIWSTANLGESEVEGHPEYGAYYTYDEAVAAVSKLGGGWRLPTRDECEALFETCAMVWDYKASVWTFTGKGDFASQSIFLPMAGSYWWKGDEKLFAQFSCYHWVAKEPNDADDVAWILAPDSQDPRVAFMSPTASLPVRAVRTDPFAPAFVDSSEAWLSLGAKSSGQGGAAERVQLWKDGPYWAACNVGATNPEEFGDYITLEDVPGAVAHAFGEGWRAPTQDDLEKLTNSNYCTSEWVDDYKGTGVPGRIFTGKGDFADKSIFLPAAGLFNESGLVGKDTSAYYWAFVEPGTAMSSEMPSLVLYWPQHQSVVNGWSSEVSVSRSYRECGLSVRAVLPVSVDPADPSGDDDDPSGDGTKDSPWPIGTNTTAYVEGGVLVIEGTGVTTNAPWASDAEGITTLQMPRDVEGLEDVIKTLPDLEVFNGYPVPWLAKAFGGAPAGDGPSVEITEACLGTPGSGIVNYTYTVSDLGGKAYDLHITVSAKGCEKTATIVIENVSAGSVPTSLSVRELLGKAYPNASLFAKLVERTAK